MGRKAKKKPPRVPRPGKPSGRVTPSHVSPSGSLEAYIGKRLSLVFLALFAISFFSRLPFMNEGLFHHDEVHLAQAVEKTLDDSRLVGGINGRYGAVLVNLVVYAPYHLLTGANAEKAVPFTAILTGALLVSLLFLFVCEIAGDAIAGIFSALFLNFNFLFLTISTFGKEHVPHLLFVIASLYFIFQGARKKSFPYKVAGAAAFAFSLTIHEAGIALLPVALGFLLLFDWKYSWDRITILADLMLFVAAVSVPFFLYLGKILIKTVTVQGTSIVTFLGLFTPVMKIAFGDLRNIIGIPVFVLFAIGVYSMRKKVVLLPLLVWTSLFMYFGNVSGYGPRYLIYIVLPVIIISSFGAAFLVIKGKSTGWKILLAGGISLAVCSYGMYKAYPLISFRKDYCGPKKMAQFVALRTEPDAIIVTMDESVYIEYYAKRKTRNHPVAEYQPNKAFVEELRNTVASGSHVYINSTAFSYDYMKHFQKLMAENFTFLYVGEVLDEDYHRPELSFTKFQNKLFKVLPK